MKIPVLVEPLSEHRFRAAGAAWGLAAEGTSSDEAVSRLRAEIQQKLQTGSRVTFIETDEHATDPHPLARFAGCMKDDPIYDEWQAAVSEYRAACNEIDGEG